MQVRYPSQRLAYPFFVLMLVLFAIQVGFGLLMAIQHIDPTFLRGSLNFNVARAEHVNLAVLWIVSGLMGTILFVAPILAHGDIASPWIVRALLGALAAGVVWNASTLPLSQRGIAGWWLGQPWLQQGLEYLEGGRVMGLLLAVGFFAFATVIVRTLRQARPWNELHWGLSIGLAGMAAIWLFGLFFVPRLDLQEYFRWYVVHYWVEGIWEILHITLIGFLIWALFGADLRAVGFAVFWGVALVSLSGLIGNGHHYFWVGTPAFWQFWGSLFSALEPLPMIFCLWHLYVDARHSGKPVGNMPALYFIVGSAVFEHVGAGLLGFTQTFALTNLWEHGTWVTPAHGHMALFGTFGMLALAGAYAAMPALRGVEQYDHRPGKLAFWLLFAGLWGLALSFAWGGTVQVYVSRVLGLDWFGAEVRPAMALSKALLIMSGSIFAAGLAVVAYDLLTLHTRPAPAAAAAQVAEAEALAAAAASDSRSHGGRLSSIGLPVEASEAGLWIGGMWFFALVITGGLLSFNMPGVRAGDPTLPYTLASLGYVGLSATTVGFTRRFLRGAERRERALASLPQPVAVVGGGT